MSALGELLREKPADVGTHPSLQQTSAVAKPEPFVSSSMRDEQIYALVQQLFFRHTSGPVRHVAFAPIEPAAETARLCFEVAKTLVEEGKYDVGLIDAGIGEISLADQLKIPAPALATTPWAVTQRLWLVPRESWCAEGTQQTITTHHLESLREYASEFDFSIVRCRPISWFTARIGQSCDGLVLLLTANKTRRLVAAQVKDHLSRAQVPLLGTVLTERRFPLPSSLYRSL
jgi:hypothetical protein